MNVPKRHWQPGRVELDAVVCETTVDFFCRIATNIETWSGVVSLGDDVSSVEVYAKGGYTYEVSVRLIDWPGKKDEPEVQS